MDSQFLRCDIGVYHSLRLSVATHNAIVDMLDASRRTLDTLRHLRPLSATEIVPALIGIIIHLRYFLMWRLLFCILNSMQISITVAHFVKLLAKEEG